METSQIREDTSINDSSLHNHRTLFKKQKANSIATGDLLQEAQSMKQKNINSNTKSIPTKKVENKLGIPIDLDRKILTHEKTASRNENSTPIGAHKKTDSFDKNILAKTQNVKNSKYYLNTSLKMFHFKSGSRQMDSTSKRSPSFSNSNLPTDLPTNKVFMIF